MNKPGAVLFILLLAVASSLALSSTPKTCRAPVVPCAYQSAKAASGNLAQGDVAFFSATSTPNAQTQSPSQSQPTVAADASLPSPFVVAAFIVGLVAVFGALLSFYWGRHRGKQVSRGRVGERFWAID